MLQALIESKKQENEQNQIEQARNNENQKQLANLSVKLEKEHQELIVVLAQTM